MVHLVKCKQLCKGWCWMVLHAMIPSKTLNNKYVPEAEGPRKNKNSPHYKLKYELHIFEQRGSASHWPIIKRRTHISLLLLNMEGKKILIRTSFFRLSPIWLVQIYKESCLITPLCMPVLNTGTKQILKSWLNQMVNHREYLCHPTELCRVGFITGHNAAIHCLLYGKHWQQNNSLYNHTD